MQSVDEVTDARMEVECATAYHWVKLSDGEIDVRAICGADVESEGPQKVDPRRRIQTQTVPRTCL